MSGGYRPPHNNLEGNLARVRLPPPPSRKQPRKETCEAFHLNANPLEMVAAYPPEDWGSVLREIERHQRDLEAERTPEQAEWVGAGARRHRVCTGRAAELIVRSL